MVRCVSVVICFLAIHFLWSDDRLGKYCTQYCTQFWQERKEKPYWEGRPYPFPLEFEKLSIEKTKDNISMVEKQVTQDWMLEDCLRALQLLVDRDMQERFEASHWEDFESETVSIESNPIDSIISKDFWQTVLFANYFVEHFRDKLKKRIESFGADPNSELEKIVRPFFKPKKTESPKTFYGTFFN